MFFNEYPRELPAALRSNANVERVGGYLSGKIYGTKPEDSPILNDRNKKVITQPTPTVPRKSYFEGFNGGRLAKIGLAGLAVVSLAGRFIDNQPKEVPTTPTTAVQRIGTFASHVVLPGESLWSIAEETCPDSDRNLTMHAIEQANEGPKANVNPSNLQKYQVIDMPNYCPPVTTDPK